MLGVSFVDAKIVNIFHNNFIFRFIIDGQCFLAFDVCINKIRHVKILEKKVRL